MPKLPILKPKKIIQKLKKLGFLEDHKTGSHIILYHPRTKKRAVVPYHLKDLPKGTLVSLLKEAGIEKEEFTKV